MRIGVEFGAWSLSAQCFVLITQISWTSFLAAFSVALRDTEDQDVVLVCLDAFRCAVRIACVFGLQVLTYMIYMVYLLQRLLLRIARLCPNDWACMFSLRTVDPCIPEPRTPRSSEHRQLSG